MKIREVINLAAENGEGWRRTGVHSSLRDSRGRCPIEAAAASPPDSLGLAAEHLGLEDAADVEALIRAADKTPQFLSPREQAIRLAMKMALLVGEPE